VEEVSPVEEVELLVAVCGDVLSICLVEEVEVSPVEVGGGVGGAVASSSCLQNPLTIEVADAMASAWEVLHLVEATEDAAEIAAAKKS
jgi:hypothetical protein